MQQAHQTAVQCVFSVFIFTETFRSNSRYEVDMRLTGSNGMPSLADAPGSLNDDDTDASLLFGGTNCLENDVVVAGKAYDRAPRPKHAPER